MAVFIDEQTKPPNVPTYRNYSFETIRNQFSLWKRYKCLSISCTSGLLLIFGGGVFGCVFPNSFQVELQNHLRSCLKSSETMLLAKFRQQFEFETVIIITPILVIVITIEVMQENGVCRNGRVLTTDCGVGKWDENVTGLLFS